MELAITCFYFQYYTATSTGICIFIQKINEVENMDLLIIEFSFSKHNEPCNIALKFKGL